MNVRRTATTRGIGGRLGAFTRAEWFALVVLIAIGAVALSATNPRFHSEYNLYVVLRNFAVAVVVGLSQMVTLAVGELNLSVGALGGLIAVALGGMLEVWHAPLALAIPLALALGTLAGALNGLLIVVSRINGFIITLASASTYTGISTGLTQAIPFYNLPSAFTSFGQRAIGPIPYVLVVTIFVSIAVAGLFARTVVGRQLLAVGGNRAAAALSGVPIDRTIVRAHTLSGVLVAVAAILGTAQLGSAQPTIGADWVLTSFAVPVIGGTALTGGYVSVTGTFLAAVVIALINNGLILTNANPYWVPFLLGVLILSAVGLGRIREARARRERARAIVV
jgi:ribose transport system permease protein